MESPEDIENALSRMTPPEISAAGRRSLDLLIDELSGNAVGDLVVPADPVRWRIWTAAVGAAAAAVAAVVIIPWGSPGSTASSHPPAVESPDAMADPLLARTHEVAMRPAHTSWNSKEIPRLGLSVGRMDEAVRAQVPTLPEGFGFVVASITDHGPAAKAGLEPYDILWKLGDQSLANEDQLNKLLCLHQEGDQVKLGIHRSGRPMEITLALGRPSEVAAVEVHLAGTEVDGEAPMKVLNPAEQNARIETADGKAVLQFVNDRPEVWILSVQGQVIYDGPVRNSEGESLVPDPWKPRVEALETALAYAMKADGDSERELVLPDIR